ncbi:hypothetical protein B566_EDAN012949 [Ephemera danica]|nr:hypothetical protein B566_EDAN012949 [Ephemera danica]
MKSNRMRYYWDERCNLLKGTMKRTVREDIAVRLSRDLKRFAANPIELINTLIDVNTGSSKSPVVPKVPENSSQEIAFNVPEIFSVVSFVPITEEEVLAENINLPP